MGFVVEVTTIVGGLLDFLGASFSSRVLSVSVDSVSMSLVLRGEKNLRVITVLVGSLPAADFAADVIDFLAVCEASLEIRLLRLFTSWKSSSWATNSNEVLVTASHFPAYTFTFRTACSSFNISVYMS
jgi:hypothetical protein